MRADRESAPRRRCPCWRCASAMIHCPAYARGNDPRHGGALRQCTGYTTKRAREGKEKKGERVLDSNNKFK
jgi:hypothetical protein